MNRNKNFVYDKVVERKFWKTSHFNQLSSLSFMIPTDIGGFKKLSEARTTLCGVSLLILHINIRESSCVTQRKRVDLLF